MKEVGFVFWAHLYSQCSLFTLQEQTLPSGVAEVLKWPQYPFYLSFIQSVHYYIIYGAFAPCGDGI